MLFSFEWLCRYVEPEADVSTVAERLTAAGLALEGLEPRGSDTLMDVDVTTNRPDCMNHLGLAREVAVAFDKPLKFPEAVSPESTRATSDVAAVVLEDATGCPRYVARVIEGVKVGPSPDWLVARIEGLGMRSINNVVDISNFVLWELGQPTHAFDLDKLAERRIVVRRGLGGETLVTLDGERRELDPEMLVIADAERAVAVAGVMGGQDSEVTSQTINILLESAHFDPTRVRETAKRLELHTDASHRFERGADPEVCRRAADRVVALVLELAGGELLQGAIDVRNGDLTWQLSGELDLARLVRFAGTEITGDQVEGWMAGLGFDLQSQGTGLWQVQVPSWRYYDFKPDPSLPAGQRQPEVWEADLFEEVLRLHGFDDIPSRLPSLASPDAGSSEGHQRREEIRWHLAACGFVEAVTYSFHGAESTDAFPVLASNGEPLKLSNPLSELYAVMRRTVLPGLEATAAYNQRRGAGSIRLFEIGHVFPGGTASEVETVGLIAGGSSETPWNRRQEFDLFDLKGVVESLGEGFNVRFLARPADLPGLVSGTGSELVCEETGEAAGFMGQLADDSFPFPLYVAELKSSVLGISEVSRVRPPSRFPSVEADLTLTHDLEIPWREIESEIARTKPADLMSFGLKGRYQGEGVPAGAVNTTLYFLYNASDRSLTQEEVNQQTEAIRQQLEDSLGWKR
ncbi:MAG: phenylalanine--tRNA ligase subunit beta [Thermoanaerobaculia bacterium]